MTDINKQELKATFVSLRCHYDAILKEKNEKLANKINLDSYLIKIS